MINTVVIECERIKGFLFDSLSKGGNLAKFAVILNFCRFSTTKLTNDLWAARTENLVVHQVLSPIVALMRHTEEFYPDFLNKSHALSDCEVLELHTWLDEELKEIEQELRQKKVDELLNEQLMKAHTDLFRPEQHPVLCYADRQYLYTFIPKLKSKVVDKEKKDWNIGLRQLLIKYNFNHMGIYKILIAEIDKFLVVTDLKKRQQQLHQIDGWLKQVHPLPNMAYDLQVNDFKTILLERIALLLEQLRDKVELEKLIKSGRICFKSSVHELALDLHYKFDEDVFTLSTKKAVAECVVKHISTEGTEEISPHSMLKFDKIEQRPAAIKYYQRKLRIAAKVKKDFDL